MQDHPHVRRETPCHDVLGTKNRASTVGGTREKGNQSKKIDKWDARDDKRDKKKIRQMRWQTKETLNQPSSHFVQQSRDKLIRESCHEMGYDRCGWSKIRKQCGWDIRAHKHRNKGNKKGNNTGKWDRVLFHVQHLGNKIKRDVGKEIQPRKWIVHGVIFSVLAPEMTKWRND